MFEELKPHLAELRKRVVISISVLFIFFGIAFLFWEPIMHIMAKPLCNAIGDTNYSNQISNIAKNVNSNSFEKNTNTVNNESTPSFFASFFKSESKPICGKKELMITTEPMEKFFMALKISFFTALLFAIPVIFWQIWLFVAPGLYDNEKKYVVPFTLFASVMFILGAMFCYFVVMPLAFNFIINFGKDVFTYIPKASEYISFFVKLSFAFGVSFELPVIALFLGKLGLITDRTLKSSFRYAIVIIFTVAAIITPPDVTSQILMAIPLIFLYGLSYLILKKVNPYIPEQNEEMEEENAKA